MKYSVAVLALVAAAVQAQTLADVPECAIPCLDDAISSETDCKTTDLVCVCKNFDDVRSAATSCVIDKCGSDVAINEVLPATEALCENPGSGGESSAAETTAAETTAAAVTSTKAPVEETTSAPAEETTTSVPPVVSTPAATTSEPAAGTPSPSQVNGAAGLKSVGALAAIALAALAL
ncbi:extracellular membrane CFEM domain-containing [Fusarium albosuccineum]|uniref:Extracellular membrane CFEM domain-containing n=1 Tax=Fusarium albosuccineum TaxID=1237068 RepID=A0A8H4LLC9_9HYPO|nr:extracellular membrane CFEM domain-containing [Fusarium albosuccineum]